MKVVILTSHREGFASHCIPALVKNNISLKAIIFNTNTGLDKAKLRKRKLKKIRKIGVLGALNGIRMRKWYRDDIQQLMGKEDIREVADQYQIPFYTVPKINSPLTRNLFQETEADLGLSLGNGYIGSKVFSIPKYGMINIHHELLPDYQGAQSVIWPIFHGKTKTGYTIHEIEKKIDKGKILFKEEFDITFYPSLRETVTRNYARSKEKSIKGLVYVIQNYHKLAGEAISQKTENNFTTPTLWQFMKMLQMHRILAKKIEQT
jgi:methionyl-tRNA formyltransferase